MSSGSGSAAQEGEFSLLGVEWVQGPRKGQVVLSEQFLSQDSC